MTTQYTPNKNLPYPQLTDTPNVPRDIQALATSVDGLTLTNFGTITSTQLISIVSGYTTGTGNLVFSNSPTLVTPILGVATATNLITNATITGSSATGAISYGTLSYSDTNNFLTLQTNANNYAQLILQNTNSGTTASSDVVISNNLGNATTYYINLGMNSSGFTGSGSFNLPNAGYLSTTTGDLVLGTTTANAIRFVVNNGTTDVITIASTGAITINNPITTTSTINGTTIPSTANLVTSADASVVIPTQTANSGKYLTTNGTSLSWAAPTILGKNAIINGGMDIWQRGTSNTNTISLSNYVADRWQCYSGVAGRTVTQQASGLIGFKYCMRYQRDSGNANVTVNYLAQSMESANSIPLAGQALTLSFWARAGANYSPTSSLLGVQLRSGTGIDENALIAGYTGSVFAINTNAILTTLWQRFTYTVTIATNVTELCPVFYSTPVGTAGANDYFEITGVQLELGSTATTFSRAGGSIGGELALCQRYYWRTNSATDGSSAFGVGPGTSTTVSDAVIKNPVTMRIAPTSVDYTGLRIYDSVTATTVSSLAIVGAGIDNTRLAVTVASGLTQYRPYELIGNSGTSYLGFSAEL
jgi:hypothetical protein